MPVLDGIEQSGTVIRARECHLKYLEDEYTFGEVFGVITVNMRELEQKFHFDRDQSRKVYHTEHDAAGSGTSAFGNRDFWYRANNAFAS